MAEKCRLLAIGEAASGLGIFYAKLDYNFFTKAALAFAQASSYLPYSEQSRHNYMPSYAPPLMRKCETCGRGFYPGAHNTKYCKPNCRHAAYRYKEKHKTEAVKAEQKGHDITENPTIEVLTATAILLKAKVAPLPVLFSGNIPLEWAPPSGVYWGKDVMGNWVMDKD